MFKLILGDSNILKTSFNAIASIVDEVQIRADDEGLRIDALSSDHITFVHLELKVSLFDQYKCDEPIHINVDTEEFMKILKRVDSDDVVELGVDENNLIISFIGEADRIFKIRLIDISYEAPSPPNLTYPNKFELPFDLLKNSMKDINLVSDKVMFTVNEDRFTAQAEGDFGEAEIRYLHGETIVEDVQSVFSLSKISATLKADKFSESALIRLGNDMPLSLTLSDVPNEAILNFIVAPRIESEA
ncbi:hypothetical protein DSECCO2_565030 [anaerobic digester metagenome]